MSAQELEVCGRCGHNRHSHRAYANSSACGTCWAVHSTPYCERFTASYGGYPHGPGTASCQRRARNECWCEQGECVSGASGGPFPAFDGDKR